jgi:hypothetical protein
MWLLIRSFSFWIMWSGLWKLRMKHSLDTFLFNTSWMRFSVSAVPSSATTIIMIHVIIHLCRTASIVRSNANNLHVIQFDHFGLIFYIKRLWKQRYKKRLRKMKVKCKGMRFWVDKCPPGSSCQGWRWSSHSGWQWTVLMNCGVISPIS